MLKSILKRFRRKYFPTFNESLVKSILKNFQYVFSQNLIILVDVGASGGLDRRFLPLQNCLQMIGFEPEAKAYAELNAIQGKHTLYINNALYKEQGKVDFYENKNPGTSSILVRNSAFLVKFPEPEQFDPAAIHCVDVTTLDDVLATVGYDTIDFIKLDTQGSELFILQGGEKALKNCFGIEVEVEFSPVYIGQPLFSDVDIFLREQGYTLFDVRPEYWKRRVGLDYGKRKGQLIWGDALYFRDGYLGETCRGKPDNEIFIKLMKTALILVLYGYLDFALEITCEARSLIISQPLLNQITKLEKIIMKRTFYSCLPMAIFKDSIANPIYEFYNIFRPGLGRYNLSGGRLGNQ